MITHRRESVFNKAAVGTEVVSKASKFKADPNLRPVNTRYCLGPVVLLYIYMYTYIQHIIYTYTHTYHTTLYIWLYIICTHTYHIIYVYTCMYICIYNLFNIRGMNLWFFPACSLGGLSLEVTVPKPYPGVQYRPQLRREWRSWQPWIEKTITTGYLEATASNLTMPKCLCTIIVIYILYTMYLWYIYIFIHR